MFVSNSVMQWYESINSYLLDKCIALSNTGGGTFIRESTWEFPVIEGVHVLSIAMSVGMILWFDLRLLGASMRNRPVSEVFRGVYWWMVGGFTAAALMVSVAATLFLGVWPAPVLDLAAKAAEFIR